jgi:hypothetical protein
MLAVETDVNASSASANTDFGLLESMLDKGNNQMDSDKALMMKETVIETPQMGMSQVSEPDQVMFDASIRTDKTIVLGKQDGKLYEEDAKTMPIPPSIECTP